MSKKTTKNADTFLAEEEGQSKPLIRSSAMKNPGLFKQLSKSAWEKQQGPPGAARKNFEEHDFPGYGTYDVHHTPQKSEMSAVAKALYTLEDEQRHHMLQELEATAISGNDILSSTFYVSGLVTLSAGIMAPLCLALVGFVLYLFRSIYHETVMALPCNGGTYNILLNSSSKQVASVAAVFNIIAYITTGVVSGLEAVAYLKTVMDPYYEIDKEMATIILLAFFCIVTNLGMKESATIAKVVFCLHVATLTLLTVLGSLHVIFNPRQLFDNYSTDTLSYPPVNMAGNIVDGTVWTAIFYGFSSAMLGVSGFETSAQFVEEQAPGVFPKTLRNMWLGIMIFNPLLSLISFSAMPLDEVVEHHDTVLARTAEIVGIWIQDDVLGIPSSQASLGRILSNLVSIDAFIVLAAALLTGYIGINGLIRRMAMDRCMPQFFLARNPWTHTDSIILVGFFVLCVSQVIVLDCDVKALGGVYCFSFLTVMVIFAVGNIMLKIKRPSLPREITTGWVQSIVGLIAVMIALLGNFLGKPQLLTTFFVYFMLVGTLVLIMFQRVRIMRLLYKLFKPKKKSHLHENLVEQEDDEEEQDEDEEQALFIAPDGPFSRKSLHITYGDEKDILPLTTTRRQKNVGCLKALSQAVQDVQDVPFIFFCKHDDLYLLNKAMLYIRGNEQTNKIIVVHCAGPEQDDNDSTRIRENTSSLTEHVKLMDLLYPKIKISLLIVRSDFSNVLVEWLSQALNVPINAMFISCPDETFTMKVSQLRGLRIIFSYD